MKCSQKKKIIIIGDSHVKGYATNIKQILGKSAEVLGYVSSGAKLNNIICMAKNEISKLTKKDVVVISGGTVDIAKNEADKGLTHLVKFVGDCSNTNVIVIGAPKRHDLWELSCVNKEVDRFNRILHKRLRNNEHVKVIDSVVRRELYTKHGLHLNNNGKELMAQLITDQINYSEMTNTNPTIHLPYTEATLSQSSQPSVIPTSGSYNTDSKRTSIATNGTTSQAEATSNHESTRLSNRVRKTPTTKYNDFLW